MDAHSTPAGRTLGSFGYDLGFGGTTSASAT
jgi:hypothetical protein